LTQGVEVELPKAGAEPIDAPPDEIPLILSVDSAGNLYVNVGDDEDKPMGGKEIVARTAAVLRNNPRTPVLVKADRSVPYGNVVGAMVLLQQGGAETVGFVTDPLDTYPVPQ
jgi:biopolymer transport protein TolR